MEQIKIRKGMKDNMDIKRITSGLLGFPLVLLILVLGNNIVVAIALAIIALLAMNEYFNAISKVAKPVKWLRIFKLFINCNDTNLVKYKTRKFKFDNDTYYTNNVINTFCTSNCN